MPKGWKYLAKHRFGERRLTKRYSQINRGAEDAAGYARPIFVDAITSMTLSDAIGLVKNGDTNCRSFFQG